MMMDRTRFFVFFWIHFTTMFQDCGAFIGDGYIRSSWSAFLTLWVLWGFVYVFRHAFGDPYTAVPNVNATGAAAPATADEEAAAAKSGRFGFLNRFGGNAPGGIASRMWSAHRLLRDNILMLLSVLVINTYSRGSTRGVFILSWIFFAFTVFFVIVELVVGHRLIRLGYSIIFFALALAIVGLAFQIGW